MIHGRRTKIDSVLSQKKLNEFVEVWGWVRTSRFSKSVSFISLNDGSSFESLQLVVDNAEISLNKGDFLTGSCLRVKGSIVESGGAQDIELKVSEIEVISKADEDYPLQKKRHSQEFLREIVHLRPRTNTHLAIGLMRNKLAWSIHNFFNQSGFKYIHSPLLTKSDCEGAGEMFRVTSLNPKEIESSQKKFNWKDDLFGQEVFLSVSGQLEGEALALAYGEIYTFSPIFRADPSDTIRHASEFWMIEPEMAFYDFEDLKSLIEKFVKNVTKHVWESCQKEIKFFEKFMEPTLSQRFNNIINEDFKVISFYEAQELLVKSGKKFEITPDPTKDLATEHERYLVDEHFKAPIFVKHYPKTFKPFYMRQNEDGKTVACLDLLVPGVGEILTGSQREERYDVLKSRLESDGLLNEDYNWYLETRRWGSAPHSGFGLGFERLLMYLTGMKNIKDVISFPRASGRIW